MAGSTPLDIYSDYVANGKLTEDYSAAELLAYLDSTSLAEYGDAYVNRALVATVKYQTDRGVFPSTGFQIALIAIAVVVLVAGGVLLRYFSRPRTRQRKGSRETGRELAEDEGPKDED
jgi:hypothetical protein